MKGVSFLQSVVTPKLGPTGTQVMTAWTLASPMLDPTSVPSAQVSSAGADFPHWRMFCPVGWCEFFSRMKHSSDIY